MRNGSNSGLEMSMNPSLKRKILAEVYSPIKIEILNGNYLKKLCSLLCTILVL